MYVNKIKGLNKIHFIGIGGAGMSALAYVLIKRGYQVSGSDLKGGYMATKLAEEGAKVYIGHEASQIGDCEAVVVSTAIHKDNCELVAAQAKGLPVLHRSDVLAALINEADGVAVAGAHGKTTTSAMLSCIAAASDVDPTVVIGGEVGTLGGNALNGQGRYVVAEADESDGSFLKFFPYMAIITNIEDDHLDHYGTEENIYQAFRQFVGHIKEGGKAILCLDNGKVRRLSQEIDKPFVTYGMLGSGADYCADEIEYRAGSTSYKVFCRGELLAEVKLVVPGRHNVLNSLGAMVAALEMGIELEVCLTALAGFAGAKRRFETKGKINKIWVVDDYAHHPTEIGVTLKAARQTRPERLICVFQPHRYTRTQLLFKEFCQCFKECDELIITEIYAASEAPIPGVSGQKLADGIKIATGQKVAYIPTLEEVEAYFEQIAKPGDLVMTIGAGDVYKVGEELVKVLEKKDNE